MRSITNSPHIILYNARVYTADDQQPWAKAVAIRKHRIVAVGSNEEVRALAGPSTEQIDIGGRLILPGLCDAHIHFQEWSLGQREVPLADCVSKAEMMQRVAQRAEITPADGWLTGRGWNESRWGETAFPTRDDLDQVTGQTQPAIFWRTDMHGAVVNSAALQVAAITDGTANPAGGIIERDAQGKATGVLKELAIGLVSERIPIVDGPELDDVLRDGMKALHRFGITAIHDQRMKDHDDGPRSLAAYQRLHRQRQLQLRINCNIAAHNLSALAQLGIKPGLGDDYLRIGHVKVFTDGSLGSRTAWMLEPFEKIDPNEADNYGVNLTPAQQMADEFRHATELGFPISVHAIGDRANRLCLNLFEELADAGLQPLIPHRIEHVQTVHPDDLPRFAKLGITVSVQPIHATDDMDTADMLLGERGAHMYNFRTLQESGALLALGSDGPVANVNPYLGFHAALYRQRPERMGEPAWYGDECISLEEAVLGYTKQAAQAVHWEKAIGSIAPGKRADLVVLDRDIFALVEQGANGREIADTQVEMTLFDGEIVYTA